MLTFETTHEYYLGSDPDIYYCEEHECLILTPDHSDTVRLHGVNKDLMLKFARKLVQKDLDKTLAKYENKKETTEKVDA